jgi:hypothetical protein
MPENVKFEPVSKQKMKEFGIDYTKILVRELLRAGKTASGQLVKSINYKLKEEAEGYQLVIESEDYLKFVDEGRRRGTYPPIKPLLQWVRIRGMNKNAAYAIQKSIFKFGIKPTNVISKVVREFETNDTLKIKYEDEVVNNLIDMINKNYKEI